MFESLGTPASWSVVMGSNRARWLGLRAAGDCIHPCTVGTYQRWGSASIAKRSTRIPRTIGDASAASNQGRSLGTAPKGCPPWRRSMASQVTSQVLRHREFTECRLVRWPSSLSFRRCVFEAERFKASHFRRFRQREGGTVCTRLLACIAGKLITASLLLLLALSPAKFC